jgi:hypothetical protein
MKSGSTRSLWLLFTNIFCLHSHYQSSDAIGGFLNQKPINSRSSLWLSKFCRLDIKSHSKTGLFQLRGGSSSPGQIIQCVYSCEWDVQGVLFLLGTMPPLPSPGVWFNPAQIGRARVHCGSAGYLGIADIGQPEVQLDPAVVIDRYDIDSDDACGTSWTVFMLFSSGENGQDVLIFQMAGLQLNCLQGLSRFPTPSAVLLAARIFTHFPDPSSPCIHSFHPVAGFSYCLVTTRFAMAAGPSWPA